MTKRICIDAGHYGKYNQSPAVKSYYESQIMWKLHLLLKKHLETYGIDVITTRSNQEKDLALYNRGAKSKGCDLFISLHSNATGTGVNESIDYPVAYAAISGKADKIAEKLTECVENVMGTKQKARINHRKGSSGADYYGVVRGASAVGVPGLILEHSFHSNTRSTNWLLSDSNLEKLAKAEAAVIAEYFGLKGSNASNTSNASTNTSKQNIDLLNGYVKVIYEGEDGLNVRKAPSMTSDIDQVVHGGTYTVVGISEDRNWYKLKSGLYITANTKYVKFTAQKPDSSVPFSVKVSIDDLEIRTGAGTNYAKTGEKTGMGAFTIVEVKDGKGSNSGWGRLKSGAGWISLDYAKRV